MPETIIIYRLGSLGDSIVALPCFNKIAGAFSNYRRVALTNVPVSNRAAPLQDILGGFLIDDVIAYPIGMRHPKQILSVIRQMRATKAKTLIYLGGGRNKADLYRDLFFFRLAGIRHVIGAPLTRELSHGEVDFQTGIVQQESARLAACLSELGPIDLSDTQAWTMHLTVDETLQAQQALLPLEGQPFLVVNMGGKWAENDWGHSNWSDLLHRLSKDLSAALVFVGSQDDYRRADLAAKLWSHPVINLCGSLTPRAVAALLAKASLFVGHDSGPMHLAAVQDVPSVVLFSGHDPAGKWYPRGSKPLDHKIHRNSQDIKLIEPVAVCQSVLALWAALPFGRKHPGGKSEKGGNDRPNWDLKSISVLDANQIQEVA